MDFLTSTAFFIRLITTVIVAIAFCPISNTVSISTRKIIFNTYIYIEVMIHYWQGAFKMICLNTGQHTTCQNLVLASEASESLMLNMTFDGFILRIFLRCLTWSFLKSYFRNDHAFFLIKSLKIKRRLKSLFLDQQKCVIPQKNHQKNLHSILK